MVIEQLHDRQLNAIDRLILDAEKANPRGTVTLVLNVSTARAIHAIVSDAPIELRERAENAEEKLEEKEEENERLRDRIDDLEAETDDEEDEPPAKRIPA